MQDYGYGQWWLTAFNIALFGGFLALLPYRKTSTSSRLTKGVFLSFIIALFTEMYCFPLTIYMLTWLTGYKNPLTHESGHMLYPELGMLSPLHFLSILIIGGGILLIIKGWLKIYNAKGSLVTDGVYSYVRHPQYLGIFLMTSGFLLQWITIPTAIMFPILLVMYYRLAKSEEKELERIFGEEYTRYKLAVPMFLPRRLLTLFKTVPKIYERRIR
ncbi:MAG: isoprenylcysteine carboxylmethyltransferase family protein [Candidatus Caldarchaeum sp.]